MWRDFLGGKTTPAAAVAVADPSPQQLARDEQAELRSEIDSLNSQIAGLENEPRTAEGKLTDIARLASDLKIKISEHDSDATVRLDELEREELGLRRIGEGLNLRIWSLQAALAPRLSRAVEIAAARDAARQDREVREITEFCWRVLDEMLGAWRESCGKGYDLMSAIERGLSGVVPLDNEHRRQLQVLSTQIGGRLLQTSVAQANESWVFARPDAFHNLKILPGRPRAG